MQDHRRKPSVPGPLDQHVGRVKKTWNFLGTGLTNCVTFFRVSLKKLTLSIGTKGRLMDTARYT